METSIKSVSMSSKSQTGIQELFKKANDNWAMKETMNKLYQRYLLDHFILQIKIRILDIVKYSTCHGCRDNDVLKKDHTCLVITIQKLFDKYWSEIVDNLDIEMSHHTSLQRLYEYFRSEDVKKNITFLCIYNSLHEDSWKSKISYEYFQI